MDICRWNRSTHNFGDEEVAKQIRQELTGRFPPDQYPMNIEVVEDAQGHWARVYIANCRSGIDEIDRMAEADPREFVGSGGMKKAVLTVTERLMAELRDAWKVTGGFTSPK